METLAEKLAYRRAYYQKNKKYCKEYAKEWRKRNSEKVKKYKKEYCLKYPEKIKEQRRRYIKKHNKRWKRLLKKRYLRQRVKNRAELKIIKKTNPVITRCTAKRIRYCEALFGVKRFYSARNLQKILGLSSERIRQLRNEGKFYYWRCEGRIFYPIKFWKKK